MFFYPVVNFKYCSPVLGCKLPRNSYKIRKQKKISAFFLRQKSVPAHNILDCTYMLYSCVSATDTQYFLCCIAHNNEASGTLPVQVLDENMI